MGRPVFPGSGLLRCTRPYSQIPDYHPIGISECARRSLKIADEIHKKALLKKS